MKNSLKNIAITCSLILYLSVSHAGVTDFFRVGSDNYGKPLPAHTTSDDGTVTISTTAHQGMNKAGLSQLEIEKFVKQVIKEQKNSNSPHVNTCQQGICVMIRMLDMENSKCVVSSVWRQRQ